MNASFKEENSMNLKKLSRRDFVKLGGAAAVGATAAACAAPAAPQVVKETVVVEKQVEAKRED